MRLATLNVWGIRGDWDARLPLFQKGFRELDAEVLAPFGPVWVANHFPDYQVDHERERCLQTVLVARQLEKLPGHVIVAGDLDAEDSADSLRFWTGRHVIDDVSVCYCNAWETTHPNEPLQTYVEDNPHFVDGAWPFRGIDHILIRCGPRGRPTLPIRSCTRTFDQPGAIPSDHYGLSADLAEAPA